MVVVPWAEDVNEDDSLWGVYEFKLGFGVEVSDFIGCLDVPVRPARAVAWYKFELVYYRLYQKLKHNVFY